MVARLLGAEELGIFGIALLVLGTLDAITATGIETSLVSRPGRVERDLDPAFTLQLLQGAAVAVLLCALAPLAAGFFGTPRAMPVLWALAAVPVLRGLASPAVALLVRRVEFRRLFWWGLPEAAAGFLVGVGVAVLRRDVWALVAAAVASQLVSTAVSYAVAPYRPRLRVRGTGARRLLQYGKWINGTRILMFLSLNVGNLVVGRFLGTAALGLYQVAFRIAEIPVASITRAAGRVALPTLTRLRRSPEQLRRRYLWIVWVVVAANGAFAAFLLLLGVRLVEWLLGPEWIPMLPALHLLAVAMVFRGVMVVCSQLFFAIGRPRATVGIHALRLLATVALLYPLTRLAGLQGVAAAVLVAHVLGAAMALYQVRAALGKRLGGPVRA